MKTDLKQFDTLIFDFGGVILDINPDLTWNAFQHYANPEKIQRLIESGLMQTFESGKISPEALKREVNNSLGTQLDDQQFAAAWNAMLLDYKPLRIEKIKALKKTHRLVLLSNTNSIHFRYFSQKLSDTYGVSFNDLFLKVYLSHEMGLIKPDLEIFKRVLLDQQLNPARTLFIEDTPENAAAAALLGIQTLVIPRNGNFYDYLD